MRTALAKATAQAQSQLSGGQAGQRGWAPRQREPGPGILPRFFGREAQPRSLDAVIAEILSREFRWGESDGN